LRMRTSRRSGADAKDTAPALFDLGRATVPLLGLVMFSEGLLGRSCPWAAATLTAALLTPVICVVADRALRGGYWSGGGWPTLVAWVLFCWMALSTVVGPARVYSDEPIRRIVALACAFFLARDGVGGDERRIRGLVGCLVCLGTVVAATAILGWPIAPGPDQRWASILDSPSLLAALLALSMPVTVCWALAERGRLRAGPIAAALPQAAALVGSGSRLPMIATAAAAMALVIARAATGRVASVVVLPGGEGGHRTRAGRLAATAVAALLVVGVLLLRQSGHESSASHRVFIWQTSAIALTADTRSILLGAGVGGFRDAFSMSRPWVGTDRSDVLAVVRDAHCDVLMVACECGIPAGLLFVILTMGGICGPGPVGTRLRGGLRAGVIAWAVSGMAHGSIDVLAVAVPAMAVLGVQLGAPAGAVGSPAPAGLARRTVAAAAVAIVAVAWLGPQASARASDLLVARAQREAPSRERLAAAVRLYASRDALLALSAVSSAGERAGVLSRAIGLYPRDAEMHLALSQALAGSQRLAARDEADEAVRLDPYNPYCRKWRAELAGPSPEAKQDLRTAIALFERTLEVATARLGSQSPQAEAIRVERDGARRALGG